MRYYDKEKTDRYNERPDGALSFLGQSRWDDKDAGILI